MGGDSCDSSVESEYRERTSGEREGLGTELFIEDIERVLVMMKERSERGRQEKEESEELREKRKGFLEE